MPDKILEALLKSMENGNWLIAVAIIAVAVIINLKGILDFFEKQNSKREDFVKEALKIEAVAGAARTFLEEELNYILFKKVTGIPADRVLREKIKDIVERSNGEIQTFQLAKSKKFIKIKDGTLNISIEKSDRFEWLINWLFAIILALMALYFFMVPVTIKGVQLYQAATVMGFGVLTFFFALFIVSQTIPLSVAKRIKPQVEKLEANAKAAPTAAVNIG